MTHATREQTFERYCALFESLCPENLSQLEPLVSPSIHFRDPFNDVRGWPRVHHILHDMFERCEQPRFYILDKHLADGCGLLRWTFETRVPVMGWFSIEGMSRLQFDDDGRVSEHLDFWDSSPFYLRLPLIGRLLRAARAKMSAG
jgi:hypothetical protein